MASISDLLEMEHLPAMPATFAQVVALLLDPNSGWDQLERVVRQDQVLAAAVLRLANSARYGVPGKRFDVRHSIQRLGRDALRRCILRHRVAGVIDGDNAAFGVRREAMWQSSFGGAVVAEDLARRHAPEDAGLAFVCGLLRDVGKLALDVKFGNGYLDAVMSHSQRGLSFSEAEHAAFGFDHAEVGAAMARRWKLPERIAAAIEKHHAPPPPGPEHDVVIDITHAADAICRWAGLGIGVDGMEYRLSPHVCERLGLDRRSAEREMTLVWDSIRAAEDPSDRTEATGAAA